MKISYQILSVEVDKLYTKEFSTDNIKGITEHCKFIQDFIEACGWSVDDYIARLWSGETN